MKDRKKKRDEKVMNQWKVIEKKLRKKRREKEGRQ